MTANHDDHREGLSRRKVLECMTWAGTGVLCINFMPGQQRLAIVDTPLQG